MGPFFSLLLCALCVLVIGAAPSASQHVQAQSINSLVAGVSARNASITQAVCHASAAPPARQPCSRATSAPKPCSSQAEPLEQVDMTTLWQSPATFPAVAAPCVCACDAPTAAAGVEASSAPTGNNAVADPFFWCLTFLAERIFKTLVRWVAGPTQTVDVATSTESSDPPTIQTTTTTTSSPPDPVLVAVDEPQPQASPTSVALAQLALRESPPLDRAAAIHHIAAQEVGSFVADLADLEPRSVADQQVDFAAFLPSHQHNDERGPAVVVANDTASVMSVELDDAPDGRDGMLDLNTLGSQREALLLLRKRSSNTPFFSLSQIVAEFVPEWRHRIVGALSNLPMLARDCGVSFQVESFAPGYREALCEANERARALGQPMIQPAVTANHVAIAVEQEPRWWAKAALVLMWLTSGWPGCVLQLRAGNVVYAADNGALTVTFVEGRGVLSRGGGAYTVSCIVPSEWRAVLAEYIYQRCIRQRARPTDPLFPATAETCERLRTARLQDALRVAHPALNLRGLHRGSLEAFRASGASPEELCARAGHRCVQTTQRFFAAGHRSRERIKTLPLATARAGRTAVKLPLLESACDGSSAQSRQLHQLWQSI